MNRGKDVEAFPSLDVWVINLDEAPDRFERTLSYLRGMPGLNVRRFPALKPNRKADGLTFVSSAAPDKTLAIALSHRALADAIFKEHRERPVLVLEDDVRPLVKNIKASIEEWCARKLHSNWDIVLLNTAGPGCNVNDGEKPGRLCGSAAAYLLSPQGAKKISNAPISWHVDIARNSDAYNVMLGPQLFKTEDPEPTGFIIGGRDVLWFAAQPCFRWTGGSSLQAWRVVILIVTSIFGIVTAVWFSARGRGKLAGAVGVPSAIVLSILTAIPWHTSRDTNFARCSMDSLLLFMLVLILSCCVAIKNLVCGKFPILSMLSLFGSCLMLVLLALWWDERRTVTRQLLEAESNNNNVVRKTTF